MSTYPGENPPPADDEPQDTPTDTELTQPVGYWERQAAEQEQQGYPGATTPYPQSQGQPQSQPPSQGQPQSAPPPAPQSAPQHPYGEIPGVNPYGPYSPGQPQYGAQYGGYPPQPGQPGLYAPQPGVPQYQQPYAGYGHVPRDHPQATMAMVLGLVSVVGAFIVCGLPLVASPFAWVIGSKALKEIRASNGQLGGEGQAKAGKILGIIGTILLVLAILGVIVFIVAVVASGSSDSGFDTGSTV